MRISRTDKETLQHLIDIFYKAAGESGWSGDTNDETAYIFTHMLIAAQKCLGDYTWGLSIHSQPITVQWLINQLEPTKIEHLGRLNEETTCLEFIIEKWDDALNRAAAGDLAKGELATLDF